MALVALWVYISHFDAMRRGAETDSQDANQSSMFGFETLLATA
jgi:hypothetical protein